MIMAYDPRKPYLSGEQYVHNPDYLAKDLHERVTKHVRTLCTALGYDLNTVEFAIKDGIPYAIDFMNPAPDAELASVGEFYHKWITDAVIQLVFKRLNEPRERPRYRWDALLNPEPERAYAVASAAEQHARTISPRPIATTAKDKREPAATVQRHSANAVSSESAGTPAEPAGEQPKSKTAKRTVTKRKRTTLPPS